MLDALAAATESTRADRDAVIMHFLVIFELPK
jgi:hypothetical protein